MSLIKHTRNTAKITKLVELIFKLKTKLLKSILQGVLKNGMPCPNWIFLRIWKAGCRLKLIIFIKSQV